MLRYLSVSLSMVLLAALCQAQILPVPKTMSGTTPDGQFGRSVSRLGDVNADGRQDVVIGAPTAGGIIPSQLTGRVHLRSGANGAEISVAQAQNLFGAAHGDEFGTSAAGLADLNADGRRDFIVGAPQNGSLPGYARVISAATGAILATPPPLPAPVPGLTVLGFGRSVANAGDVNNDGVDDYAVGAPFTHTATLPNRGMVQVYSGATGANLVFVGSGGTVPAIFGLQNSYFGIAVAAAGDFNGDGYDDLIVGAHTPTGVGTAKIISGRWITNQTQPATFANLMGNFSTDHFGYSVHGAGDLNGDGLGDVVVGAPNGNYVETFLGSTTPLNNPAPFWSILWPVGYSFGYAVSGGLDVSGDGRPDIVVGARHSSNGFACDAVVYNGVTAATIRTLNMPNGISTEFGLAVDLVPDINANGRAEILIGEPLGPYTSPNPTGRALLYYH